MSWRLYRPRSVSTYEARIIRRVLEIDGRPHSEKLLTFIEQLIVHEEGGGGFQFDSLDFITSRDHGHPIAGAIGRMANDAWVELVVWARDDCVTMLELEPFNGARLPIRIPLLETIRAYPADAYLCDGSEDIDAPKDAGDD